MKFNHEIVKASWTDEEAKWTLSVRDLVNNVTVQDKVDLFLEFNGPVRYVDIIWGEIKLNG